jgi:hypothetical protein
MTVEKLRKRYRTLWQGEAAAIVAALALFIYYARGDAWINWFIRTYALAVVIVILLQGVAWWLWKLRVLDSGERTMPAHVLRQYRAFRNLNWLLIALLPLVLWAKRLITGALAFDADFWVGLLIWIGAILEQINYYYVQLMYDNPYDWAYLRRHRRLRPGTVAKAMAAAQ